MEKREKLLEYTKEPRRVAGIADTLGIGKAMTHRYLKRLLKEELIRKIGKAPVTYYMTIDKDEEKKKKEDLEKVTKILDELFKEEMMSKLDELKEEDI